MSEETYYTVKQSSLTAVADAIREKGGTSESLSFPNGFVNAIGALSTGGGTSEWTDISSYFNPILENGITSSGNLIALTNGRFVYLTFAFGDLVSQIDIENPTYRASAPATGTILPLDDTVFDVLYVDPETTISAYFGSSIFGGTIIYPIATT